DGGKSYISKFIIIEEPEQNLHPRLQSKLADLFAAVAEDESYNFLVETHSEYLIRRTQVLVAEMNLTEEELEKQNPFKVYYFPHNGSAYDMKYLPSGRFDNKFGEGFFDESAKWHLEILKKEKARK
ncbi:MAG: AAA family ATPase, partial [Bacteroidales bacterium]|nr:AAA family ATPase [Bacteroidales bacterium]